MASKRAAYQRRGRTALLGAGAIFLTVQLVGGLLLDWRGLAVRFPSAARVLETARRGGRPDIVLLGTSRFMALQPALAGALLRQEHPEAGPVVVCSAAVPMGDAVAQDYILERLLAQGSRPRLAVVEVSPDIVGEYNIGFAMHSHRQIAWLDAPAYLLDVCRVGQLRVLAKARFVPLYAHRRELVHQAVLAAEALGEPPAPAPAETVQVDLPAERPLPWDKLLRLSSPPVDAATAARLREAAQEQSRRFRDYRPGGGTGAALERLLRRCRDNGVEVVLVGAPVTSYFREDYTPAVDAAYTAYLGRVTRTFGCRFIDCRDAVPDEAFADLVHLNSGGSRYFTCKLTRDVLSPWLAGRPAADARP